MSWIHREAITERAVLNCDAYHCDASWCSPVYTRRAWGAEIEQARPAFDLGWRIFAVANLGGTRTYCPSHGPKSPMQQIYPEGDPR